MKESRVWVLGSSNLDTTFLVDRLPQNGESLMIRGQFEAPGGKGANTAVVCRKSGAPVSFIGCIGADPAGDSLLDAFQKADIDTTHLLRLEDTPTGRAYVLVDAAGDNIVLVSPGANQQVPLTLSPSFSAGDWLVTQYEVNLSSVAYYLRAARQAGVHTLLNPSPFLRDEETLALADYLVLNETEAAAITGYSPSAPEQAGEAASAAARQYGCAAVVITLGERGAVLAWGGRVFQAPGFPVAVTDTQGAGDTFFGVFTASLYVGLSPEQALHRANIAAALSVQAKGSAQTSFPGIEAIDRQWKTQFKRLSSENAGTPPSP